jgi:hypothetical protein
VRARLLTAQQSIWRAIGATRSVRNSELWSWSFEGGHYRIVPFGSRDTDADESNAAQLWSTVYLAVKAPRPFASLSLDHSNQFAQGRGRPVIAGAK